MPPFAMDLWVVSEGGSAMEEGCDDEEYAMETPQGRYVIDGLTEWKLRRVAETVDARDIEDSDSGM